MSQEPTTTADKIKAYTGLVTAVGVIIIAVITPYFGFKAARIATAAHVETKAVHRLVNSQQTHMLKTIAIATRQLAIATKKPEDESSAVEAERQYADRLRQEKAQMDADAKAQADANPK